MAEWIMQIGSFKGLEMGRLSWNHLDKPFVITKVLIRERWEGQHHGEI